MDRTVEGYLAELRIHLAGADPALVQDALYDAEEYLRSALDESAGDPAEEFDRVVEAYGTPTEIAASYRDAELTVAAALRQPYRPTRSANPIARFFAVVADPQAWGSFFYLLLSLATGVIYFTIVVTGVSLSLGMAILVIGIPMALLVIAIVRAISFAEGRIVEGLLGTRMPRRPRLVAGASGTIWQRIKGWLTDWRTWTTMLYMVLQMPLGILYFTLITTAVATSTALIALPFVQMLVDQPVIRTLEYGYYIEPWGMPLFIAAGLLGYVVTLWMSKGIGLLHGMYAKTLLVGRIDQPIQAQPVMTAPPVAPTAGGQGGVQ